MNDKIILDTNKVFKLVKEIKELLPTLPQETDKEILEKYRLKLQMNFFNNLLEKEGNIDELLQKVISKKLPRIIEREEDLI